MKVLSAVTDSIYQSYIPNEEHRAHLGGSLAFSRCERKLWFTFHWAEDPSFKENGRMYRLFETGKLEENRFVRDLSRAGFVVHQCDHKGKQFRLYKESGHVSGEVDAYVVCKTDDYESEGIKRNDRFVGEFKTHNAKSFNNLIKKGVLESKPEHYTQLQLYILWTIENRPDITNLRGLYVAKNKDTDELYLELVDYNENHAKLYDGLMSKVVRADEPLQKVTNDKSFYLCKMCDYAQICHGAKVAKVNCRTCVYSKPLFDNGKFQAWECRKHETEISRETMPNGCEWHIFHPVFMHHTASFAKLLDSESAILYSVNDVPFRNGKQNQTPNTFSSHELRAIDNLPAILKMPKATEIRDKFDGEIIGITGGGEA